MMVKLRNMRKSPIIGTVIAKPKKDDDGPRDTGARDAFIEQGEIGDFDGDNPGIQIYAMAGHLEPTTKAGREWLDALRKKRDEWAGEA